MRFTVADLPSPLAPSVVNSIREAVVEQEISWSVPAVPSGGTMQKVHDLFQLDNGFVSVCNDLLDITGPEAKRMVHVSKFERGQADLAGLEQNVVGERTDGEF